MLRKLLFITTSSFFCFNTACANTLSVPIFSAENQPIGKIEFKDSRYGLIISPNLSHLAPGMHGFHIHQHPDCGDHGMKAMGHWDPEHHNHHLGPYAKGHLGDLPVLSVDMKGNAKIPVLAPRLKVKDLHHHAIMIHAGADTYSDHPELGGGGARIACGVIKN
jgi:Cu-Zn family superoxide dismutase